MDYKYIEQLLERYWNCETSLEEEQILRTFFSQKEVPANLLPYKDLFCYEQSEVAADALGDDFDARLTALVDEPEPVRAKTRTITQQLMPLMKAAATVALFLTLGNVAQLVFNDNGGQDVNVVTFHKAFEGPAVALGDSVKADTLKSVATTVTLLK